MSLLGIRLQMLIGEQVPRIAPLALNEALQSVEVTHGDQGRSGFQLTFQIGRGLKDIVDYSLVTHPLLQPFNRVILIVIFNITPHTLMDGIITNHQLSPGSDPGASTLTVTGEDVSLALDLEQHARSYPTQRDNEIVMRILREGEYTAYRFLPDVPTMMAAPVNPPPNPQDHTPAQPRHRTDLAHIQELAQRYGYVFYVKPGDIPGTNTAYWGPSIRLGMPQPALSANMGPFTNVESVSFQFNGMAPNRVTFLQNDAERTLERSSREPALVRQPATPHRRIFLEDTGRMDNQQVRNRAQGMVDESFDEVVTASGELDALRYGAILEPRRLVNLRGMGQSYDGTYYVKRVSHKIDIRKGEYKQSFSLAREGLGALSPVVRT